MKEKKCYSCCYKKTWALNWETYRVWFVLWRCAVIDRSNLGHALHHWSPFLTHPGCSMKDSEDQGQLLGDRKLLEQWKQKHETQCHNNIETEDQTNWWPCISQGNTKPASQRFSTLECCWRLLIGGFLLLATDFQLFTLLSRASKLLLVQLPTRHQQPPGAVPRDHRIAGRERESQMKPRTSLLVIFIFLEIKKKEKTQNCAWFLSSLALSAAPKEEIKSSKERQACDVSTQEPEATRSQGPSQPVEVT